MVVGVSLTLRLVKDNSIDVVHSHGYKSNFYGFLASLGLNIKRIATCHNWLGKSKKMKFYEKLDKLLLSKFDKVVVVSDALKKDVLRSGIFEEKVVVIDNGIDIDKFKVISDKLQVKKTLGIREEGYVVGTVGRLTEEKGHIYLIEAFRKVITKFSNAKLLIVGDGPLREDLELAVSSMKLKEKVVFAGMREDIPEMLNIMDMFVLPSLTEGMPMALLEAMASQTPIIATKVGAIPKIIDNGHSGLLIDPNDVIQLSRAIVNLLKSKEKAQSLSQNAYNLVKKRFSSERMAGEYAKVYESLFM